MGSKKRQRERDVKVGRKERLAEWGMRNNRQTGEPRNSLTFGAGLPGPAALMVSQAAQLRRRKTVPVAEDVDLVVG